jgi:hypothetical protein
MLSFLKRLFGLEVPPVKGFSAPTRESSRLAQVPTTYQSSSGDYFATLGKLQEAISKRDYERAAILARENMGGFYPVSTDG